jgi:hypothetical protein
MPVFAQALLQELATQVTGIIQVSPLHVAHRVPITPTAQQQYEVSQAAYLRLIITTFVDYHPLTPADHGHINNTPQTVIVMVLNDLLSLQTITQLQYTQILDQLFRSNQQEMTLMKNCAMSSLLHNSGIHRTNTQARHPPNYASPNLPRVFLPRNEVTENPPIDIIVTQTAQQSIPSQLSGPNSHSSKPVRRQRYHPINNLLPPVEGDFSAAKSVVENVFSGCPNRTSPSSPIFRSRPGHLRNQRNWQCKCGLIIQARKLDDSHNVIHFYKPVGQDLPHQGAPPEPAVAARC